MSAENDKKQTFWEKLQHTYRLVVMNNETFEEIGSFQVTLLNVYIALSTVIVLVAFIVVMLIAFTPLRQYVPGYGDVSAQQELVELYEKIDIMEEQLDAHKTYADNFRKMLTGDVQSEDEVPKTQETVKDTGLVVERIKEDEQLRKEVKLEAIGANNSDQNTKPSSTSNVNKPLEQLYFSTPINGEVSADFNPGKKHFGVDVVAPKNTAIKATMDGFVFMSDWTLETGNTIGIQHTNNIISFYKHNSILLKKVGSYVKAGEAVAIIGNTGELTDGPHLHFELWFRGKAVNPKDYINF